MILNDKTRYGTYQELDKEFTAGDRTPPPRMLNENQFSAVGILRTAMYLQQLQQKSFFFRFLVKFFTLSSFMHSAFQYLRRFSRVPAFTI